MRVLRGVPFFGHFFFALLRVSLFTPRKITIFTPFIKVALRAFVYYLIISFNIFLAVCLWTSTIYTSYTAIIFTSSHIFSFLFPRSRVPGPIKQSTYFIGSVTRRGLRAFSGHSLPLRSGTQSINAKGVTARSPLRGDHA